MKLQYITNGKTHECNWSYFFSKNYLFFKFYDLVEHMSILRQNDGSAIISGFIQTNVTYDFVFKFASFDVAVEYFTKRSYRFKNYEWQFSENEVYV